MGTSAPDNVIRKLLLWLIISAAFTAMVIQYSYAHGKLLCPPFYDDVSYFEDALHRLEVFHEAGIAAVVADYAHSPPHSAFSSFVAAGAFGLLGVRDWAPYAANGLMIVLLLAFLDLLNRDLTLPGRGAIILMVLCVPVCRMMVYEFRPDIPSALFTAMGASLLNWRSLTASSWRYRSGAGALFGLALLAKPPTSPLTLVILFSALGAALIADWVLANPGTRKLLAACAQCVAPAILIPLPHYLADRKETYNYIYQVVAGPAHSTWALSGTVGWHLRYYFDGPGGSLMLDGMRWPLVAIVVIGLATLLIAGRTERAVRLASLLVVAAVAYAIPAVMDVKETYFGTTFDWLLTFAAVFVLGILLRKPGWLPWALVGIVCVVSLAVARLGPRIYERGSPIVQERNRLVNDIYAALLAEHFPHYARIYMTSTGFVNPGVFDYFYRRDTLHALNIGVNAFADNLSIHQREIRMADYVIASESGNNEAYGDFVKSGLVQDQTLELVRANSDFQPVASFPTLSGKYYFLFRRTNPFCGWIRPAGLIPAASDDQSSARPAYWAMGSATKLIIPAEGPPKLRLVAHVRTASAGLRIRVSVDGHRIGQRILNDPARYEEFTLPFTLHSGGEHVVELSFAPPTDGQPVALLSQLEIIPDEQK